MNDELVKTGSLWKNAQSILIVPNTVNNSDVLFAAFALAWNIKKSGKKADVLNPGIARSKIWKSNLDEKLHPLLLSSLNQQYAIKLSSEDLDLKDVHLVRSSGEYQIVLEGDISEALTPTLTPVSRSYDLLILLGSPSFRLLSDNGWDKERILEQKTLLVTNAGIKELAEYPNLFIYKGDRKSFSQKVLSMFHAFDSSYDEYAASLLLSGIISFTADFTKNVSASVFSDLEVLFNNGADFFQGYAASNRNLTLRKIREIGEVLRATERIEQGIYASEWDRPHDLKLQLKPKDLLKFSEIYDCELAFVYLPSATPGSNKVYLRAFEKKSGLKEILKDFSGKGSNYDGVIITSLSYEDFKKELLASFKKLQGEGSVPQPEVPTPLN